MKFSSNRYCYHFTLENDKIIKVRYWNPFVSITQKTRRPELPWVCIKSGIKNPSCVNYVFIQPLVSMQLLKVLLQLINKNYDAIFGVVSQWNNCRNDTIVRTFNNKFLPPLKIFLRRVGVSSNNSCDCIRTFQYSYYITVPKIIKVV